jgi:hypothetical protein
LIRIAITAAAFDAVSARPAERLIWLEPHRN